MTRLMKRTTPDFRGFIIPMGITYLKPEVSVRRM